jgi:DinB superfamily
MPMASGRKQDKAQANWPWVVVVDEKLVRTKIACEYVRRTMRIRRKYLYWAFLVAWSIQLLTADPMNERDRQHLIAHLQMTASWLPDEVSSLSQTQLNFRSAPGKWTVAEVVQHLVIAEPNYWRLFHEGMNHPPKVLKDKASDADVLWYGIDRTRMRKRRPSRTHRVSEWISSKLLRAIANFIQPCWSMSRRPTTTCALMSFQNGVLTRTSACSKFLPMSSVISFKFERSKLIEVF